MIRLVMLYLLIGLVIGVMKMSAESFKDRDIKRLLPKGWTRDEAVLWFLLSMLALWPVVVYLELREPSKKG